MHGIATRNGTGAQNCSTGAVTMSAWREALLSYLKKDWQDHGCDSHLCEYFRQHAEQMPRVKLKRAHACREAGMANTAELFATCLGVCQEHNLLDLKALERIADSRRDDESIKAYNRRVRENLKALMEALAEDPQLPPGLDGGFVRNLAEETLSHLPETSNQIALAMECYWDCKAGSRALGSSPERDGLCEKLRRKASRAKQYPVKWDGMPSEDFIEKEVIPKALMQRAYTFLDNAGVSFSDAGGERFVSHTFDIPVALVESCIMDDEDLAADLMISTRSPGRDRGHSGADGNETRAEKTAALRRLYRALCEDSGGRGDVVVPVEIDPDTGLGLYVIGANFARRAQPPDPNTERTLLSAFGKYSALKRYSEYVNADGLRAVRGYGIPFFAIMYRGWFRADEFAAPGDRDPYPGEEGLVRNLWDLVVNAWVPARRLRLDYAEVAYRIFELEVETSPSLDAYAIGNDVAPRGCPERFRKYFDESAGAIDW